MADSSAPSRRSSGRGRGLRRDKSVVRPGGMESSAESTTSTASIPSSTCTAVSKTSVKSDSSTASNFSDTLAKRPDFGTVGRPIQLRSNNFVIKIENCPSLVYQYRVDISCEFIQRYKKDDNYAIFWAAIRKGNLTKDEHTVLYDGGNLCFTSQKFDIPHSTKDRFCMTVEVVLPLNDLPNTFTFSIFETNQFIIDFNDKMTKHTSLTILDLAFRQVYNLPCPPNEKKFHAYGRSFFYPPMPGDKTGFDLDGGRQVWGGYFFGVKMSVGKIPIINIDIANSVFVKKQSVLQFMCDVFNQDAGTTKYRMDQLEALAKPYRLNNHEVQILTKAIKGLLVIAQTSFSCARKVWGVVAPAEECTFKWNQKGNARKITVADYFAERHGKLRYPFFPCLEVGKKSNPAYLPLEKCEMYIPQRVVGKITDQQTAAMIKGVCTDAVERERRIFGICQRAQLDQDPFSRKFGFTINPRMMETQGRVLNAPALEYSHNKIYPREGAWNMGPAKFFVSAAIASYGVVSFINVSCKPELECFCNMLMETARRMGMQVDSVFPLGVRYLDNTRQILQGMNEVIAECAAKGKRCDFILVPMYAKNAENYAAIKSVAEKELGIITQVVIQRNIRQPKPTTCSNIVLKLNAKLGGINCKLVADDVTRKYLINQSTLILGIDVTHPAPTDKRSPSIGAAVGNIDTLPAKFGANVHVQKHRREAVIYLSDAIRKRVTAFYHQTQRKPERIIVYRDGVAETQFEEVLTEESKSILQACAAVCGADFKPKITFIIVQKRHHTRLFCCNQQDMCGRGKNVPPGTVVDRVITHPEQFDFYLCSHFGIQGTSRPAHYHVLRDDNHFSPDELQAISYHLCHMYVRCTRAVSIPAPTYYAHLACNRARHHLRELIGGDCDTQSIVTPTATSGDDSSSSSSEEDMKRAADVVDSLATKMYFC